jgi:transcriptional regulator with XRE-family HTH domain
MASPSPTVAQRRLARTLRRLRADAGMTIEQVAEKVDLSASTISRLETAQASARRGDVRELLDIYKVTGTLRDELVQLAEASRRHPWWKQFKDLPNAAAAGLEAEAAVIRHYAALVVPGLLQTRDYASEVLRVVRDERADDLERRLKLRMDRQDLLTRRTSPPQYLVVLDEAVVRRAVGGPRIMHAQFERLLKVSALRNVTLRLLPFAVGAHTGMDGGFTIFSYHKLEDRGVHEDPDVVFLENLEGDDYIEDARTTDRYKRNFQRLLDVSLDSARSIDFIAEIAAQLQES